MYRRDILALPRADTATHTAMAEAGIRKKSSARTFRSLAEQAYHAIEDLIVTLQLAPGSVLSEQQLAKELSVGRSPVREAIQRLAHENLVVVLPRRGILVSEINLSAHRRLLEVRREVERLVTRLACKSAGDEQSERFGELACEFRRAAGNNDVRSFMRVDAEFNDLLADSVDNEFAVKAFRSTRGLSRRFWYRYYRIADLGRCALLHAGLAEAIGRRDAAEAARGLDRLIDYMDEFTRAIFAAQ